MNPLISASIDIFWHGLKRFASVILVTVLLIGIPYFVYNKAYQRGYSKGYAQCAKDRPTYGSVGSVTNISEADFKYAGIYFKLLFLRLKLGR